MLACSGANASLPIAAPNDSFGAALFRARTSRAMLQVNLAARIGRPRTSISEWENGRLAPPKEELVAAIAKALDLEQSECLELLNLSWAEREQVRFDHATPAAVRALARTLKKVEDQLLPHQVERLLRVLQEGLR